MPKREREREREREIEIFIFPQQDLSKETRPAANVRSEDCVGRERKRETSVCICEIEKVRD